VKPRTRSPLEVAKEFRRTGTTVAQWARDHGVHKQIVHDLLTGKTKGHRGKAHRVAVLLGMKDGEIVETTA